MNTRVKIICFLSVLAVVAAALIDVEQGNEWHPPIANMFAKGITLLTLFCGYMLALRPPEHAAKAFRVSKDTDNLSDNAKFLLNAIGWCNLSTGLTSLPLVFDWVGLSVPQAVALGVTPRLYLMVNYYIRKQPKGLTLMLHSLIPVYGTIVACIAAMFSDQVPFLEDIGPAMAVTIIGRIYLFAGVMLQIAPNLFGMTMNYDLAKDPFGKGLLRAQGKTDAVAAGQLLGLGMGYSIEKALGLSSIAWACSILLNDIIFQDYVSMGKPFKGVVVQFLIAILSIMTMYFTS